MIDVPFRRRGYPPAALRKLCELIGVTKALGYPRCWSVLFIPRAEEWRDGVNLYDQFPQVVSHTQQRSSSMCFCVFQVPTSVIELSLLENCVRDALQESS